MDRSEVALAQLPLEGMATTSGSKAGDQLESQEPPPHGTPSDDQSVERPAAAQSHSAQSGRDADEESPIFNGGLVQAAGAVAESDAILTANMERTVLVASEDVGTEHLHQLPSLFGGPLDSFGSTANEPPRFVIAADPERQAPVTLDGIDDSHFDLDVDAIAPAPKIVPVVSSTLTPAPSSQIGAPLQIDASTVANVPVLPIQANDWMGGPIALIYSVAPGVVQAVRPMIAAPGFGSLGEHVLVNGDGDVVSIASDAGGSLGGAGGGGAGTGTAAGAASQGSTTSAFVINVTYDSSVANAPAGFKTAVAAAIQYLESQFTDAVTININVGFGEVGGQSLDAGALGESLTYLNSYSYSQIRNALITDAKTGDDSSAIASLPTNAPVSGTYWVSSAEAKALGLAGPSSAVDGYVGFASGNLFDYDSSNGVTPGQYDFFGVFVHEITEVMGRMLLVGGAIGNALHSYDLLDLFHYSGTSSRDFSGPAPGYFSVDGGVTNLDNFNTNSGGDFGDWAQSAGHDSFLAFSSAGVANAVTTADLRVMDAIGWDQTSPPDLTVSGIALNGNTLSYRINNNGSGAAGASTTGIYLSTDSTITNTDLLLTTIATSALSAGASILQSVAINWPTALTPGTYYLGVLADESGQIGESNENNNASSAIPIILGNSSNNTLTGTSGNDTFIGSTGTDFIDGGQGTDNVIYGAASTSFTLLSFNNETAVLSHSLNIQDELKNIENIQFTDQAVASSSAVAFDAYEYLAGYADLISALGANPQAAFDHYVRYGYSEGRSLSAFDGWEYLASNPSLIQSLGANPDAAAQQYVTTGFNQGLPTHSFDAWEYLASNPDLIPTVGTNPGAAAQEYVTSGYAQGRPTHSFDAWEYLASYPDLISAIGPNPDAGAQHYVTYGINEGRSTNLFDAWEYLASNPSLIQSLGANPDAAAQQYVTTGFDQGLPTHSFDGWEYLASNPDLIATVGINPDAVAQEYVTAGYAQGRPTHSFDAIEYIASNPDLIVAFGNNPDAGAQHYVQYGFNEHRSVNSFDAWEYLASNPSLIQSLGANPDAAAQQYVMTGFNQGLPTQSFDAWEYLASNPDLISTVGANPDAAAAEYVSSGYAAGRPLNSFNAEQYLANYADLQAAFGDDPEAAAEHYAQFGVHEGRTDNSLSGSQLGVFVGNSGDNTMTVGSGDTMTGGAGNDAFVFKSVLTSTATITDFTHGSDVLDIQASAFGHGLTAGSAAPLVTAADIASAFHAGPDGYFIFDNAGANAGTLYWEPNGGNGANAIAIAHLTNVTSLTASDFHLV